MKWIKIGRIFNVDNNSPWMNTHASNVVPEYLNDNIFKIYFTTRDIQNKACIAWIIIDIKKPDEIIDISKTPVIQAGETGTFDDRGTTLACITNFNKRKYLYYLGWNLAKDVPFRNAIGLAVYNEKENIFEKISKGPIMDRNIIDPFSLSYPFVTFEHETYKMWYGSHKSWGSANDDMIHALKYAESKDGINWDRKNHICIDTDKKDYAFSRPIVIKEYDIYKMWYSYRGEHYKIGYAESQDGINWSRKDDIVGIYVSKSGWDCEMICYPYVFDFKGDRFMLYNGNGYGKTGFGLAIMENDAI